MKLILKKKYTIFPIIFLLLLTLGAILFTLNNKSQESKKTEKEKVEYYHSEAKIPKGMRLFGSNKEYIIMDGNYTPGNKYYVTSEINYERPKKLELLKFNRPLKKGEYFNVVLFDLNQEGFPIVDKIDLFQLVASETPSYNLRSYNYIYVYDADCIVINLEEKKNDANRRSLLYNLETRQFIPLSEKLAKGGYREIEKEVEPDLSAPIYQTNFNEVVKEKGYLAFDYISSTAESDGIPLDLNVNLFAEYPEIKEQFKNTRSHIFPRPGMVTVEEWFNTRLHWLATKGQDSLVLDVVDKNWQPTGQKISSYQDYITYVPAEIRNKYK